MRDSGFPGAMGDLLVAGVACLFLAGTLGPPILLKARERSRVTGCANNLHQLWKMENVYMSHGRSRGCIMPHETGKDFWLKLVRTTPPLIEPCVYDVFSCPLRQAAPGLDVHYLGPASNVNAMADSELVGCDEIEHPGGGGSFLRKSGDLCEYRDYDFKAMSARCAR